MIKRTYIRPTATLHRFEATRLLSGSGDVKSNDGNGTIDDLNIDKSDGNRITDPSDLL